MAQAKEAQSLLAAAFGRASDELVLMPELGTLEEPMRVLGAQDEVGLIAYDWGRGNGNGAARLHRLLGGRRRLGRNG